MINKKEIQYKNYGRCLEIKNNVIKLIVTLDFGPRIINYSFVDGENIFFEDVDRVFSASTEDMGSVYGEGAEWKIYGGHRIWTSPEKMPRTYYPDNDAVSYEITDNGAIFTPPVQKWTQYGFSLNVSLLNENSSEVSVEHNVTNYSPWDIEFSIWPISVLSQGGTEVVPQPTRKTGCIPKMRMAFWDYTKLTDKRLTFLNRYIILRQDIMGDDRIKYGINCEDGFAMYFNHGDLFINQFNVNKDGNYPDGGMSFETYTNPLFLEMETLSELKKVKPAEKVTHIENWMLVKQELPVISDKRFDEIRDKYIKSEN